MSKNKQILKAPGIYLRGGSYHQRLTIDGKRTWRALGTSRLDVAISRVAERAQGIETGTANTDGEKLFTTLGEVLKFYTASNYRNPRNRRERPKGTLRNEKLNVEVLQKFWENIPITSVRPALLDKYCDFKFNLSKRKCYRTVDRELCSLNNAIVWAIRNERLRFNPLADIKKPFQESTDVMHCRAFKPSNSDVLHDAARFFFRKPVMPHQKRKDGEPNRRGYYNSNSWEHESAVFGWQILVEAMTGLRTAEAIQLKWTSEPEEPGFISEDGNLHVRRVKKQDAVNPYVEIHPALKLLLAELKKWHDAVCPKSQWFFPSLRQLQKGHDKAVRNDAIAHALARYHKKTNVKITSHSLRSFFVTIRRSQGKSDEAIAAEIGQTSGGKTLTSVYGAPPDNWKRGMAKVMTFLPTNNEPAWMLLESSMSTQSNNNSVTNIDFVI